MNDWDFWIAKGIRALDRETVDVATLLSEGRVERWGHRAVIHHRNDIDELYIVLRGGVEVDHDSPLRLTSGDLFGLKRPGVPPVFRAYDETELVAVERSRFEELVDENGLRMEARVRNGVRAQKLVLDLPLATIIGVGPLARVAWVLNHLGENAPDNDQGSVVLPNLKPRHLSGLAALDRDSTRRAFNALVDDSVVESPVGSLVIPSVENLQHYIETLK